ncbi:MAG TPA: Asp-tRNA(Asn)/Glu-tRNA(Gln) amidotransferase subunit GatA [Gemmatimonadaceae bacterium]|nr:Asp-tRNA(Asn)/Glu-tRNA(Gln) amidotransferase subunit GatA [Gemmatimonadaceae bacterium]
MALSAAAIAESIRSGQRSPAHVAEEALARAREADEKRKLNIFLSLAKDAPSRAARLERDAQKQEDAPLLGVPYAAKDNLSVAGLPVTCGSRILEGYVSPYTATVIERMTAAGAVLVGKTNMDEFAMGSSTEYSAFGMTRNPLAPELVPGGSSGGSAAAVAAGVVPIALGSETGGSVRQPAAFCGIVGVKPTYGRVSRHGLVAFASSLDQVGVFGRDVGDAAVAMRVISGRDDRDATSADVPVPDYSTRAGSLEGVVIGKPREYFPAELDPKIAALCERALDRLRALGAEVRDVSLPHTAMAIPVYYIVAPAEASSNLARFDGVRYGLRESGDGLRGMYEATRSRGFGPEVTRRIMLGTYVLSAGYFDAYYGKAMQVRTLITEDFRKVFAKGVHALFTPTTPTTAFAPGSRSDPYEMYLSDIFTCTANLAGVPAISVPIGRVGRLPAGGQFMCAHFEEQRMFQLAFALEAALGAEAHQ